jgi:hypothetical protein
LPQMSSFPRQSFPAKSGSSPNSFHRVSSLCPTSRAVSGEPR